MTMSPDVFPNGRFYSPSGIVSKKSVVKASMLLLISAVVLGVLYGIGRYWVG